MGLGVTLPLGLGLLGMGGSLFEQFLASLLGKQSTEPGYYPGTRKPGEEFSVPEGVRVFEDYPGFVNTLEELSKYSSQPFVEQYEENQRARDLQAGYADRAIGLYEGTDVTQQDRPGMTFQGRIGAYDQQAADINRRQAENTAYVQQKYKETAEAGTGGLEAKLSEMVSNMIGGNQEAFGQLADVTLGNAAARGVSPAARAQIEADLAAQNRRANQQQASDIAEWGLGRGKDIELAALQGLERVNDMLKQEGATSALLRGMGDKLFSQWVPGMQGALYTRGALDDPENLLAPGEQLDMRNLYNTAMQMGAHQAMAQALANMGGMGLNFGMNQLSNKALQAANQNSGMFDIGGTLQGAADIGSLFKKMPVPAP